MPKPSAKSAAVAALVTAVLPMQDIVKLSIKEACQRFADRAVQSQRAFAEMGKLHFAISACLKKGQTIYGELRKLGVKDSTISNASYAARVWADLIDKGHLKEPDFDTFTFADCLAICRAMGDKSQLRLAGPEVAAIVRAKPDSFDAELESIYATGFTVEEAEKQAKAEVEAKAKAEADQKAKAEAEAKAKAEQEKQAAVQKALADQAAQQAAATAAAGSTPTPETQPSAVAPAPQATPAASTATGKKSTGPDPAPSASAPSSAAPKTDDAPAPAPELPTNVVPMPVSHCGPDPDAAAPEWKAAVDELFVALASFSKDAQIECLNHLSALYHDRAAQLGVSPAAAA